MKTTDEWFDMLSRSTPELGALVKYHVGQFQELYHGMFLRGVLRYFIVVFDDPNFEFEPKSQSVFQITGDLLACAMKCGDDKLQNIITAGFLSPYGIVGHRHPKMTRYLGDKMFVIIREYEAEHGYDFNQIDD